MKNNAILIFLIFAFGFSNVNAQETSLSLKDAVSRVLEKSDAANLASIKASTKKYELESLKNNRYPDAKISGQYMRLTNADINLKSKSSSSSTSGSSSQPVNQLLLGQVNISMHLFSGFKLKNSIDASENVYQAELATAEQSKERTAMTVIEYYAALYQAQQTVTFLQESLKSSQQRVTDFKALEQNGIIARNDLLKSQLQVSKIQLSLAESEKKVKKLNNYLVSLLKLSPETKLIVSPSNIDPNLFTNIPKPEAEAIENRKDRTALNYLSNASNSNIKVARSAYYPSLSLSAGYIALDLQNVVTVQNAMNVGLGFSYNLSSLFKTASEIKVAKSKAQEIQLQQAELTDAIKLEITNAKDDYDLAVKQDQVYAESVNQASENYRIVKDKYDNGLSTTNDLLEADVEQLNSKINQADAKANVALKYYELLNTTGQLLESFNLSKP